MSVCRDCSLRKNHNVTYRALDAITDAILSAGCGDHLQAAVTVTGSGNLSSLAAQLSATDGAVNNGIVRTLSGASCSHFVLLHSLGSGVTQGGNCIGGVSIAASASIGGVTGVLTIGSGHNGLILVALSGNVDPGRVGQIVLGFLIVTGIPRAAAALITGDNDVTILGAGRRLSIVRYLVVA